MNLYVRVLINFVSGLTETLSQAGKVAQIVVQHSVNVVVQAWSDDRANPDQVIDQVTRDLRNLPLRVSSCLDQVLEAFHHPYFNVGRSRIQGEMFRGLECWVNELQDREGTIGCLTKVSS